MCFEQVVSRLKHSCDRPDCEYIFYDVSQLGQSYRKLPFSRRILLECAVRRSVEVEDEAYRRAWRSTADFLLDGPESKDDNDDNIGVADLPGGVLFQPGRVVLQDFTGVAALIDLATLRDVVVSTGGDPVTVDSACPVDLVVDHSVQIDFSQIQQTLASQRRSRGGVDPTVVPSSSGSVSFSHHHVPSLPSVTLPLVPHYQHLSGMLPSTFHPLPPHLGSSECHSDVLFPDDNPGLPIQEEICPFHQHMSRWAEKLKSVRQAEMTKNSERFGFLKWVDSAFENITVVPPGTGILHQLNLEYLARVVMRQNGVLFPDSLVGTDNHTATVSALGVLAWTVDTLDAESVMFGHPMSLRQLPRIVGVRLHGCPAPRATSTDLVLMITKRLRKIADELQIGEGNKKSDRRGRRPILVEFFGPGVSQLSVSDRSSIANMCGEYGALTSYFPVDEATIKYLRRSGRDSHQISVIETYLKQVLLFRSSQTEEDIIVYDSVIEIDLAAAETAVSGPKNVKEKIPLERLPEEFMRMTLSLCGSSLPVQPTVGVFSNDIVVHPFRHGTVFSAAIASCSNSTNPSVMLAAGLLAKKAVEAGLSVPKFVNTSLAPGSGVVTMYLRESGVMPYLYMLGFEVVGYGCATCVNNASTKSRLHSFSRQHASGVVCCGVLAGNRNFHGRLEPELNANFLTSAPLVIAFALAGRIDINFDKEPLNSGDRETKPVFLADIWPTRSELQELEMNLVVPAVFNKLRETLAYGNMEWSSLLSESRSSTKFDSCCFDWKEDSTVIRPPRYVWDLIGCRTITDFDNMRCLAKFGDDVSSDHISPAGSIVRNSPAAEYLSSRGLTPRQFNSYGARRGNWEVMTSGTFSHLKLRNLMAAKAGPYTVHHPSHVPTTIVEAAKLYRKERLGLVIIAGCNFGNGTSRDWATKGPLSLGVRVVMAISFDENYRANLVKTGILPLQLSPEDWKNLKGDETFDVLVGDNMEKLAKPGEVVRVKVAGDTSIRTKLRLDSPLEVKMFKIGGVLMDTMRKFKL